MLMIIEAGEGYEVLIEPISSLLHLFEKFPPKKGLSENANTALG